MATFAIANCNEHAAICKHGQVYTVDEIKEVVAKFGMPDKYSSGYDRFIEIQVWDDRPICGRPGNI